MPDQYGDESITDAYARRNCDLCDERGIRNGFTCDHTDHAAASKRGMDMIRETMGWES